MNTATAAQLTSRFSATGLQALSSSSLTTAAPACCAAACNGVSPCIMTKQSIRCKMSSPEYVCFVRGTHCNTQLLCNNACCKANAVAAAHRLILSVLASAVREQQVANFQGICLCSQMKRCDVLQSQIVLHESHQCHLIKARPQDVLSFCHCSQRVCCCLLRSPLGCYVKDHNVVHLHTKRKPHCLLMLQWSTKAMMVGQHVYSTA